MKRDHRLVELSREHHTALKLARQLKRASISRRECDTASRMLRALRIDVDFHFEEEEVRLLPVLWRCGRADLAERLCTEHSELRALLCEAEDGPALELLGKRLEAHVRFEEREMFPGLEVCWATDEARREGAPGFSADAPVWLDGRAAMLSVNLGGN